MEAGEADINTGNRSQVYWRYTPASGLVDVTPSMVAIPLLREQYVVVHG